MEIIYLFNLIKKHRWLIAVTLILFLGLGVFFYLRQEEKYEATLLFYVKRKIEPVSSEYYSYDGYYASQVAKEYSDTVVGFFQSVEVLKRAGEISHYIPTDVEDLNDLSQKIRVTKEAPQLIKASIVLDSSQKASEVIKAVGQAGIERVLLLNQTGDPYLSVDVVDSEPLVFKKTTVWYIFVGSSFLVGLGIGIAVSLSIDFLKKT